MIKITSLRAMQSPLKNSELTMVASLPEFHEMSLPTWTVLEPELTSAPGENQLVDYTSSVDAEGEDDEEEEMQDVYQILVRSPFFSWFFSLNLFRQILAD